MSPFSVDTFLQSSTLHYSSAIDLTRRSVALVRDYLLRITYTTRPRKMCAVLFKILQRLHSHCRHDVTLTKAMPRPNTTFSLHDNQGIFKRRSELIWEVKGCMAKPGLCCATVSSNPIEILGLCKAKLMFSRWGL